MRYGFYWAYNSGHVSPRFINPVDIPPSSTNCEEVRANLAVNDFDSHSDSQISLLYLQMTWLTYIWIYLNKNLLWRICIGKLRDWMFLSSSYFTLCKCEYVVKYEQNIKMLLLDLLNNVMFIGLALMSEWQTTQLLLSSPSIYMRLSIFIKNTYDQRRIIYDIVRILWLWPGHHWLNIKLLLMKLINYSFAIYLIWKFVNW